jgi:hypothetical protein
MEDLSDRKAAEAVRSRLDLKYLLSLPLADEGFDYSVLSEFYCIFYLANSITPSPCHCSNTACASWAACSMAVAASTSP